MKPAAVAAVIALVAFVVCRDVARAADPTVTEVRVLAPVGLTVGDHLRYVIRVEADRGTSIGVPADALPPELTITQPPDAATRPLANSRIEITLTLEMAAWAPGEIQVPPLRLAYRTASGATGELETRPTAFVVESVLPDNLSTDGALTPRDLKPQVEIGTAPVSLLAPAAAVAAVLLLSIAAFAISRRLARRRAAGAAVEAEEPGLTAEDRARAVLDRAGSAFAADGDFDAYYAAISVTVREYLTERFEFPAFALTTRELQQQMVWRGGVDRWQARIAGGLLSQCDAVIFAHYRPAAERADADLTAAYEIVEMSRPETAQRDEQVEGVRAS